MSDTNTPSAEAPAPEPVAAVAAPPETRAPEPEPRSPFVVLKPIATPDRVIGGGHLVSLTERQAKQHAALVRAATAGDLAIYGRPPAEL
jgi:hypothetical protein